MYCPTCGTQNAEGASFCRACGANVSLVPQALAGQLPAAPPADSGGGGRKTPSIERAVTPFFGGLGFILVAFAIMLFMPGGTHWGFWMFIPAFFMMGSGAAEYLKLRDYRRGLPPSLAGDDSHRLARAPQAVSALPPREAATGQLPHARPAELPRERTAPYAPGGSVTEGTTRLLERDE